jgi:hypothetical protein
MSGFVARSGAPRGPNRATLAVNAGTPYDVITYSYGDDRDPVDMGLPKLTALVMIRAGDEDWVRDAEQMQHELICVLDPAEPSSQIGAFTFMGRVTGFRELRTGQLAAEFTSVGPVMPHFMRR